MKKLFYLFSVISFLGAFLLIDSRSSHPKSIHSILLIQDLGEGDEPCLGREEIKEMREDKKEERIWF